MPLDWTPEIQRPSINPRTPSALFYGPPGIGKTTAARDLGRCCGRETFFIATQNSHNELECMKPLFPTTWEEFKEAITIFLNQDAEEFPIACVDTADAMVDLARTHLLMAHGEETLNKVLGGWGEGHDELKRLIETEINRVLAADRGLIGISHWKTVTVDSPGTPVSRIIPSLKGQAGQSWEKLVGNIFLLTHPIIERKEMKSVGTGQKRLSVSQYDLKSWRTDVPDLEPHDRVLCLDGCIYYHAKIRTDGAEYPAFVPLPHPSEGNTMRPFYEFWKSLHESDEPNEKEESRKPARNSKEVETKPSSKTQAPSQSKESKPKKGRITL